MKVLLYYVGKPRDGNANALADEFIRRSSRYARCEMREVQPARFDPWEKHPSATKILLDPAGKAMDSGQFAKLIGRAEEEARDLVFLVGGASGLPAAWRENGGILLSLTALSRNSNAARIRERNSLRSTTSSCVSGLCR